MSNLLIVPRLPVASVVASRGDGVDNLLARDPKEVWADSAVGTVTFGVDLGAVRTLDTILLGHLRSPVAGATWSISASVSGDGGFAVITGEPLRVPDVAGDFAETSHALWHGDPISARYLSIEVTQPTGDPLTIGTLWIGASWSAALGQEWGAGRQPVDTGTATPLVGGGFAIVEGAVKRHYTWTFGDLSLDEAEQLELIALAHGETAPIVVIDDASPTPGLRSRIFYGRFKRWAIFERKNRVQTRWEVGVEEWL